MDQHIHKYQRVDIGVNKKHWVMRCVKSNCSHYIQMNSKFSCPLLMGKIAECNRCNNEFTLNKRALQMTKPCCDECVVKKGKKLSAEDFFKELSKNVSNL